MKFSLLLPVISKQKTHYWIVLVGGDHTHFKYSRWTVLKSILFIWIHDWNKNLDQKTMNINWSKSDFRVPLSKLSPDFPWLLGYYVTICNAVQTSLSYWDIKSHWKDSIKSKSLKCKIIYNFSDSVTAWQLLWYWLRMIKMNIHCHMSHKVEVEWYSGVVCRALDLQVHSQTDHILTFHCFLKQRISYTKKLAQVPSTG